MDKLDQVIEKLDQHGNRLTSIETNLKYHIKRSDRLETVIQRHEKYFWLSIGAISVAGPIVNSAINYYLGKH